MSQARFILLGGFLGAGKTIALAALADHLASAGKKVGIVVNDHGGELVDTAIFETKEFATEEVSGGSFCGRFDRLTEAVKKLEKGTPDVLLAEPVGSCADLVATVIHPLRKCLGESLAFAPFSVLVDPLRAERVLGLIPGEPFSEKVRYIYRKQLEEADLIVIAKVDLIDEARLERLRVKLAAEFPQARVLAISVRTGAGLPDWVALLVSGLPGDRPAMEIDYDIHAEGEALVGWLNSTIEFYGAKPADAQAMLLTLLQRILAALPGVEIAHFKIALRNADSGDVAVIHLLQHDAEPEMSRRIDAPVDTGELMINLRAEASPEALHTALRQAVVELAGIYPGLKTEFAHLHYFRPIRRPPTQRMISPAP